MKKLLGLLLVSLFTASFSFAGGMTSVAKPGGADTQVQFNNAGAFGAYSGLTLTNTNRLNSVFFNATGDVGGNPGYRLNNFGVLSMGSTNTSIYVGRGAGGDCGGRR